MRSITITPNAEIWNIDDKGFIHFPLLFFEFYLIFSKFKVEVASSSCNLSMNCGVFLLCLKSFHPIREIAPLSSYGEEKRQLPHPPTKPSGNVAIYHINSCNHMCI